MLYMIEPPAELPVTMAEAKANSRVTANYEDLLIGSLIEAATQDAEHVMQRAILSQQWRLTLDAFPSSPSSTIDLRRPTVLSVDAVKYVDASTGTLNPLAPTEWLANLSSDFLGQLSPAYGKAWPATRAQPGAVQVLFTCGWATPADVPSAIKAWILQRVSALYAQREAWTLGKTVQQNEHLHSLLARWCVPTV